MRTLLSALQFAALEQLVQALGLTAEGREVLFAQACSALRHWSDLNFQGHSGAVQSDSRRLLTDPSGDYPQMPARDRGQYRKRLEQLSRRKGIEETEAARALVEEAEGRHIGFLLFREDSMPVRVLQAGYYPGIAIVSLILALWLGFLTGRGWSFFLFGCLSPRFGRAYWMPFWSVCCLRGRCSDWPFAPACPKRNAPWWSKPLSWAREAAWKRRISWSASFWPTGTVARSCPLACWWICRNAIHPWPKQIGRVSPG